jgi:hypothetical protein
MLPHYLEAMMDNFSLTQEKMNQVTIENPLKVFETLNRSNVEIIENSFKLFYKAFKLKKLGESNE